MMKSIIIESDKKEDCIRHNADQETMEKNDKEQAKLPKYGRDLLDC